MDAIILVVPLILLCILNFQMPGFHCTCTSIENHIKQNHFCLLFLGSSGHLEDLNSAVTFYHIEFDYLLQLFQVFEN